MRKIIPPTLAGILLAYQLLAQSQIERGKDFFQENKPKEAASIFQKIKKGHQNFAEAQFYLGRIAFDQPDAEKAADFFEVAIEEDENVAEYHYWLGNAYGTMAREANIFTRGFLAPKIKHQFEETVRLDPTHIDGHWGLITFYTEAPGIMGGSWAKAEETARNIMKLDPVEGHRALGTVYEQQEKFNEAEKEYEAAYRVKPDNMNLIFALGYFYQRQNKTEKSITLFENYLKSDPENMSVTYQLGRACAMSGQKLELGEECMKKYLTYQPKQNEPSHAGALMRLGMIYEKSGETAKAKSYYQQSLQKDPEMEQAKEGLDRLK